MNYSTYDIMSNASINERLRALESWCAEGRCTIDGRIMSARENRERVMSENNNNIILGNNSNLILGNIQNSVINSNISYSNLETSIRGGTGNQLLTNISTSNLLNGYDVPKTNIKIECLSCHKNLADNFKEVKQFCPHCGCYIPDKEFKQLKELCKNE